QTLMAGPVWYQDRELHVDQAFPEKAGTLVLELKASKAQLRAANKARADRRQEQGADKTERDHQTVGLADHGRQRGAQKENTDEGENPWRSSEPRSGPSLPAIDGGGPGGAAQQHENAGRIGAALGQDVGAEQDRDRQIDAVKSVQDQSRMVRPLQLHAQAVQVLRHEIAQ